MIEAPFKYSQCLATLFFLNAFIGHAVSSESARAETWICPQPGQSDLYTDRCGPGCRQLGDAKTYSPLEISPARKASQPTNVVPTVPNSVSSGPSLLQQHTSKKPLPFPDVSLSIPVLGVGQAKAGSITGSWVGLMARVLVTYKGDGKGPEILPDSNMRRESVHSLYTAVVVATKAVGYDPRYLTVRLLIPTPMDGPSAGGIFAVGIAAALLGDQIRHEICMSGTIEPDAEIHAVGRLVDKMSACRDLNKTMMIVPDALDNSHLNFTGAERSIHVIEVHTLAEAYHAATGLGLRQVP